MTTYVNIKYTDKVTPERFDGVHVSSLAYSSQINRVGFHIQNHYTIEGFWYSNGKIICSTYVYIKFLGVISPDWAEAVGVKSFIS